MSKQNTHAISKMENSSNVKYSLDNVDNPEGGLIHHKKWDEKGCDYNTPSAHETLIGKCNRTCKYNMIIVRLVIFPIF